LRYKSVVIESFEAICFIYKVPAGGTLNAPGINPGTGSYAGAVSVTLSSGALGGAIYYTTNGNDPTESSTRYTAPIIISTSLTLKAKTFKTGLTASPVASAIYTIAVDNTAPTIVSVSAKLDPNKIIVVYNEPVDKTSAELSSNYVITGLQVSNASLSSDFKTVTLTAATMTDGQGYSLNVSNVKDASENVLSFIKKSITFTTNALGNGLVGYWNFDDGTAKDAAGSNDGTVNNATQSTGYNNSGLSYVSGNYVSIPNASVLEFGAGDFSISAWWKSTGGSVDIWDGSGLSCLPELCLMIRK